MGRKELVVLFAVCCAAAVAQGQGGRASLSELQDPASLLPTAKMDIAQMFEEADTNNDERVTYDEAHSYNFLVSREQFDSYDLNHDGYIDRAEAGLSPVELNIAEIFEAADKNNDEKVSFDEAYGYNAMITRSQFDGYDADRDGFIDREEAGLPPVEPGGCAGCSGAKSLASSGDWLAVLVSLLGLAAMAGVRRF